VCGDLLTSLVVARSEGATLVPQPFDVDPTVVEPGELPLGAEPSSAGDPTRR
jgi:hypothetical protein